MVIWYRPDEDAGVIRVLGVFCGGEDHPGRMILRLTGDH